MTFDELIEDVVAAEGKRAEAGVIAGVPRHSAGGPVTRIVRGLLGLMY